MNALNKKLVIIGDIAYETSTINNKHYKSIGGSGYYSAIGALAANNRDFILVSTVGFDFNLEELNKLHINTKYITTNEKERTACFFTVYNKNSTRSFFSKDNVLNYNNYGIINKLVNANIIFFSGSKPERQLAWIRELRKVKYNGLIASDVFELYCKTQPEKTMEVIMNSDIVFMNNEERSILNCDFNKQQTVIIKNGSDGATLLKNNSCISVRPEEQVKAIDTNGAGDILAGVFLSNILLKNTVIYSLQNAINIATKSVTKRGVLHIL